MKVQKVKCKECGKIIEGTSEKGVNAWLEQHKYYMHKKGETKWENGLMLPILCF